MKKTFRKEALARRSAIPESVRTYKSSIIAGRVLSLPETAKARTITLYVDYRNEVETRQLILQLLEKGKRVALPVVDFNTGAMHFVAVTTLDSLVLTEKKLWEPAPGSGAEVPIDEIDLILTPGAAFDRNGYRMGYGGGFYDRILKTRPSHTRAVALAFSEQVVDFVPAESHDVPLDGIITDEEVIWCKGH